MIHEDDLDIVLIYASFKGHWDHFGISYLVENEANVYENYDCSLRYAKKYGYLDVIED